MRIRVIVVGDHRLLREGLCSLLSRSDVIQVLGEASESAAVALSSELQPDVVILQMSPTAIEAATQLRAACPTVKVVSHSASPGRRNLSGMLNAGATGYLEETAGIEDLIRAIEAVAGGRPYLSVSSGSLKDLPRRSSLTTREIQVLRLLATGKRVKDVARILKISVKTVETHRQNLMDKLGIHNTVELAHYALREGLIEH
jgi:two-component system response regulator NreC